MPVRAFAFPDGSTRRLDVPSDATPDELDELINSFDTPHEQFGPPSPLAFGNKQGSVARAARQTRLSGRPSRPGGLPSREANVEPTPYERMAGTSAGLLGGTAGVLGGTVALAADAANLGVTPFRQMGSAAGTALGGGSIPDIAEAGSVRRNLPGRFLTPIAVEGARDLQNVTKRTLGVRPQADVQFGDYIAPAIPAMAATAEGGLGSLPKRSIAPIVRTAEELPETTKLAEHFAPFVKGGRVTDPYNASVRAAKEVGRAGIVFDPKNPGQFLTDLEQATNRAQFARSQLVSSTEAGTPNIASHVATDTINQVASSTGLSTNESEAIKRMTDIIDQKKMVSARDLHNLVEQFGSNVPGPVKSAIYPMIDANAPGYVELGHHQAGLIDAKAASGQILRRHLQGSGGGGDRAIASRAMRGALKGGITGLVTHGPAGGVVGMAEGAATGAGIEAATDLGAQSGSKVVVTPQRLAAATKAIRSAVVKNGIENPTAKALASVLPPESPSVPLVEGAIGRFGGRESGGAIPITDPRVGPQQAFGPTGPTTSGEPMVAVPQRQGAIAPGPRALLPPTFGPNVLPSSGITWQSGDSNSPRFHSSDYGTRAAGVEPSSAFVLPKRSDSTPIHQSPDASLVDTASGGGEIPRVPKRSVTVNAPTPEESPTVSFTSGDQTMIGIGSQTPSGGIKAKIGNVGVELPPDHPALQPKSVPKRSTLQTTPTPIVKPSGLIAKNDIVEYTDAGGIKRRGRVLSLATKDGSAIIAPESGIGQDRIPLSELRKSQ